MYYYKDQRQENILYFQNVVLPFYKGLDQNNFCFIIYSANGEIISVSNKQLKLLGYTNSELIIDKTFEKIYLFNEQSPSLVSKLENLRKMVIREKITLDYICIAEFTNGKNMYLVQQNPIFFPNGDCIGSIELFTQDFLKPKDGGNIIDKLSRRQAEILFLLTIGASQKEIANVFGVTRGTIARSIDIICSKLSIFGSSERNLTEKAIDLGYGCIPLEYLESTVVPISRLCDNSHILKHIVKKPIFNNL